LTDDRYGPQAGGPEERGSFGCSMVSVSLSEWGCAAHLPPLVCAVRMGMAGPAHAQVDL